MWLKSRNCNIAYPIVLKSMLQSILHCLLYVNANYLKKKKKTNKQTLTPIQISYIATSSCYIFLLQIIHSMLPLHNSTLKNHQNNMLKTTMKNPSHSWHFNDTTISIYISWTNMLNWSIFNWEKFISKSIFLPPTTWKLKRLSTCVISHMTFFTWFKKKIIIIHVDNLINHHVVD